jgi:hypothetical protein
MPSRDGPMGRLIINVSFLLDQKGPKNQGPIEICLTSLRNFGKKYFSAKFLRLLRDGKFQNGRLKIVVHIL